jgi:hypothetical protein
MEQLHPAACRRLTLISIGSHTALQLLQLFELQCTTSMLQCPLHADLCWLNNSSLWLAAHATYEGDGAGLGRGPHSAGFAYSTQVLPNPEGPAPPWNMFHCVPSAGASSKMCTVRCQGKEGGV